MCRYVDIQVIDRALHTKFAARRTVLVVDTLMTKHMYVTVIIVPPTRFLSLFTTEHLAPL